MDSLDAIYENDEFFRSVVCFPFVVIAFIIYYSVGRFIVMLLEVLTCCTLPLHVFIQEWTYFRCPPCGMHVNEISNWLAQWNAAQLEPRGLYAKHQFVFRYWRGHKEEHMDLEAEWISISLTADDAAELKREPTVYRVGHDGAAVYCSRDLPTPTTSSYDDENPHEVENPVRSSNLLQPPPQGAAK